MSTLLVAVIIISITVIPPIIFLYLNKKSGKKRSETLLNLFRQAGAKHEISCSKLEVLKNKILGFDAASQKLLLFQVENVHNPICIDMTEVQTCCVQKEYDTMVTG